MDFLRLICVAALCSGCQMGYLIQNGWNQMELLTQREDFEFALSRQDLSDDEKRKIKLALEAKKFASEKLGLNAEKVYTQFVKLDRPYVTWVVSASEKWKIESYKWTFPLVGNVPYKGYFNQDKAKAELEELKAQNLDALIRGVSAFSTLGWFKDPILSSMLNYQDYDLVDTIIHELVHGTLFIKNHAQFNERMAVFVGQKGMELFYQEKEGPLSAQLIEAKKASEDQLLFSEFISNEIKNLNAWYSGSPARDESLRQNKFREIQNRFNLEVKPKLKTRAFAHFGSDEINNATLALHSTYLNDLSDFESLYKRVNNSFDEFFKVCKSFETSKDPEIALKNYLESK